ncbi:hypothetical protein EC957_001657 [Mortierella hygrophila]|uniref:Uncharacterized protein n=1 Tax=Mortierella hygrophila TaxID=979708 RepID=A0A9P6F5A6_9FUNG|nr:hypothetical protein EC957_001657 [Mortierella hygrophila]
MYECVNQEKKEDILEWINNPESAAKASSTVGKKRQHPRQVASKEVTEAFRSRVLLLLRDLASDGGTSSAFVFKTMGRLNLAQMADLQDCIIFVLGSFSEDENELTLDELAWRCSADQALEGDDWNYRNTTKTSTKFEYFYSSPSFGDDQENGDELLSAAARRLWYVCREKYRSDERSYSLHN